MEEIRNFKEDPNGCLVASKYIKQGETVLCVPPLTAGPGRGHTAVCLGCCTRPETALVACSGCGWPLCDQNCKNFHPPQECEAFKGEKCDPATFNEATNIYDYILPLRVSNILKTGNKDLLEKAAKVDVKTVIKSVRDKHEKSERSIKEKLTKFKVSNDEIERSVSLLERYCIPLDNGARGLYPETMKLTHSCSPNTYFIGLSNGWCIYRAAVDINEGDLLTTLHIPTCVDKCNYFRSKILQEFGIKCSCDRCTDSTELGTGFGSLLCTNCQNFVAPEKPGEFSCAWRCVGCGSVEDGSKCTGILDSLNKQILDLPKAATQRDPIKLENIIREKPGDWSRVPDSHQLILDVRKQLAFTYQYHTDYYFPKCDFLNKKENHCKLWLEQMDILAPGWSYEKVLMKYELGSAMTSKIQAMKEAGFQSSEVNDQCYKATEMVEEPIKMMIEEEELSLCTALKQIKMIAIEAREEQKTRVYLNMWADDEEEDW